MSELIRYKNIDWEIINELEEEKILISRNCFTKDQALKYFSPKLVGENGSVKFNEDYRRIFWNESPIRDGLNGPFLSELDKEDLNIMKTESYYGDIVEDYVRLITRYEVNCLHSAGRETLQFGYIGYWTMSSTKSCSNDYVEYVPGRAEHGYDEYFSYTYPDSKDIFVRPVISLKTDNLAREMDEELLKAKLTKMIWRLYQNYDYREVLEFSKRFDSILRVSSSRSKEVLMLLELLGIALLEKGYGNRHAIVQSEIATVEKNLKLTRELTRGLAR